MDRGHHTDRQGQLFLVSVLAQSLRSHTLSRETRMNMAKPIDLVARYIRLRDQMQADDKRYAEFRKQEYDDPMKEIEDHFTKLFEETGSDSMKTRSGTVYRKMNVS